MSINIKWKKVNKKVMQRFEDFGLSTEMLNALSKKGFDEPS